MNNTKKIIINPLKTNHKTLNRRSTAKKKVERNVRNSRYDKIGKIEPIFRGETIFLIGGGPSLKGFDFEKLKGKRIIAINKAFLYVNFADVLYWTDSRFYNWYKDEIHKFKGLKVTNKPRPVTDDIINLKDGGRTGLDADRSKLRHGNNSGYAAINLAVHLGARTIVLLGFDMEGKAGGSHWHDGYKITHNHKVYVNSMLPHFKGLVVPLKDLGVSVWNSNPQSAMDCFPKCNIEDALKK